VKHGETVATFEREFAAYVGARYAIAMTNGTVTLEVALRALGIGAGDRVATTPLTMAATSMAVLNVGAVPVYRDVDARTWMMCDEPYTHALLPVSLYGLHWNGVCDYHQPKGSIVDAAQTMQPFKVWCQRAGTLASYSFQRSKILNTGEGGMLVTDSEELATRARSISSLGYDMDPRQPRIDSTVLKSPDYARHVRWPAMNARMNDATAALGLQQLAHADSLRASRLVAADCYRQVVEGCDWLTPQHVPDGWQHDYWCYAVALVDADLWHPLADAIEDHGGERPYAAWRITYQEPAFRRLVGGCTACDGRRHSLNTGRCADCNGTMSTLNPCPDAESLQPRLMQFQTNTVAAAAQNARALRQAITDIGGTR